MQPGRGHWTIPAGFLDAGEDPQQAAVRECHEETGLDIKITELLDVIAIQEHDRGAHILILYRGEIISGELTPGDDADAVAFFSHDDLPPLAFSSTESIIFKYSDK
jgi:ADP-ribose pyrophosphatase YjhB (NUDIX family)